LVRTYGSSNTAKLGEQLRGSTISKTLGVISEPREVNENERSSEAHTEPQPRGVTDVLPQ